MIFILKLDLIAKFENEFKQEFNQEEKYLPISEKLVVLLRDIEPAFDLIKEKLTFDQKIALDVSLQIHRNYAAKIEIQNKELSDFNEAYKSTTENLQKDKIVQLQAINLEQKEIVKDFETKKVVLKETYEEKLKKIDQQLKREISQFNKEKVKARKINQDLTRTIEDEQKETLSNLDKVYQLVLEETKNKIQQFKLDQQKELEDNALSFAEIKKDNDKIYLDIKNNYHLLTKEFNVAINQLRKVLSNAKIELKKDYESQIKPVNERLEQLNSEYAGSVERSKKAYQTQLLELDNIFNIQKENYEEKKSRIIRSANESITLLNSKLSAYRETITQNKIEQSRAYRDLIKESEEGREKEKINHELTRILTALDNDLNKQILRTQKDIITKQREQQHNSYDHDIKHLREINDWRLKRNILSYEHKQDLAKIDLNFDHNLLLSKNQLKLYKEVYKQQSNILEITLRKDLLPLEIQLSVQSLVQERELNLLNNDQHLADYTSKLKIAKINHQFLVKSELEKLKEVQSKLTFDSETQVVQITTQLELEKTKSKRDFIIEEHDIRLDITQAIYEKNKQFIHRQYMLDSDEIDQKNSLNLIEKKYKIEQIKLNQQLKHNEQDFLLLETKAKHQARQSHEKALRLMKLYLNELNLNQKQSEHLFYLVRMFYQKHIDLKNIIKALYLLPSHPEVFKQTLKLCLDLVDALHKALKDTISYFKDIDKDYYQKKIEDQTGYKYMIKHEDSMNLYEIELNKKNQQKQVVENDIKTFEKQFFVHQQNLERQEQFVTQFKKIAANIQSGAIKVENKHQELKENQKLISNHEKEIKITKNRLAKIEKLIDQSHQKLIPYDKQIQQIHQSIETEQRILNKHKERESIFYASYFKKNQDIYDLLLKDALIFVDAHSSFIHNLIETTYVTDSLLFIEEKKLKKEHDIFEYKMIKHQQAFLNHIHNFYLANDDKQTKIIKDFEKGQQSITSGLRKNKRMFYKYIDQLQKSNIRQERKELANQHKKHQNDQEVQEFNSKKNVLNIQNHIKSLENNLQVFLDHMKQDLKLIHDNQTQVASQSLVEYEKMHQQLLANHQKQMTKFTQQLESEDKNYQNIEQSILTKNQILLTRFEQNRQKSLLSFQEKDLQLKLDSQKANQSIDKEHKNYEAHVVYMQEKRALEIRNMREHQKSYEIKATRSQQKEFKYEQRQLKKSLNFRLKSLNLK